MSAGRHQTGGITALIPRVFGACVRRCGGTSRRDCGAGLMPFLVRAACAAWPMAAACGSFFLFNFFNFKNDFFHYAAAAAPPPPYRPPPAPPPSIAHGRPPIADRRVVPCGAVAVRLGCGAVVSCRVGRRSLAHVGGGGGTSRAARAQCAVICIFRRMTGDDDDDATTRRHRRRHPRARATPTQTQQLPQPSSSSPPPSPPPPLTSPMLGAALRSYLEKRMGETEEDGRETLAASVRVRGGA